MRLAGLVDELDREHPVDLEDEPGFLSLSRQAFATMRERGVSFATSTGRSTSIPRSRRRV